MERLSENACGVVGSIPCNACGHEMQVKFSADSKSSLPYTAQCTSCKAWYDCRQPKKGAM